MANPVKNQKYFMLKNIPLNIPNLLSLYRVFMFPVILFTLFEAHEILFVWLICINLITDILDGWIARRLDMQTEIGARIDSIADVGTYIGALIGIFVFKYKAFEPHILPFYIFIGLFLMTNVVSWLKFGRFPSLHLYSSKVGGYIQGFFFFTVFVFDFYAPFYYVVVMWGIAAFIESIIIQLILKEMRSNAKGLYWVLKDLKR
ncbi:MAG: CDP-alcohol phosphatidyltransferase family protein [Bacteroidota bacterium]